MQKIAVITVSDEGRQIAEVLQQEFQASVIKRAVVAKRWKEFDAFIFVGAMGICVRTIASLVEDKHTDPAVICVDSMANPAWTAWQTMSFRFCLVMWAEPTI